MSDADFPLARFTISDAAKNEIEHSSRLQCGVG